MRYALILLLFTVACATPVTNPIAPTMTPRVADAPASLWVFVGMTEQVGQPVTMTPVGHYLTFVVRDTVSLAGQRIRLEMASAAMTGLIAKIEPMYTPWGPSGLTSVLMRVDETAGTGTYDRWNVMLQR